MCTKPSSLIYESTTELFWLKIITNIYMLSIVCYNEHCRVKRGEGGCTVTACAPAPKPVAITVTKGTTLQWLVACTSYFLNLVASWLGAI